ncbi:MAG: RICIN domain-containing protein [Spirochaetales bacterium]|nr:RICIN domain-containing protein [Spirochaetales bacterium]
MKKNVFITAIILVLLLFFSCDLSEKEISGSSPDLNGVQSRAFSSADSPYFPLFQLFLGKSNSECDGKITAMINHFFNGNATTQKIYFEGPNTNEAYIKAIDSNDVRSEGMSYAMMICVQLDMPTEFAKLWKWVDTHMSFGNHTYCWQCNTDGSKVSGQGSAPDGEEYLAMSLFLAANRWNNSTYRSEAKLILDAMLANNFFDQSRGLVRFIPGSDFTDPSYILPHFYELWAEWCDDTAEAAKWKNIADKSRQYLRMMIAKNSACLNPDYANWDGTPHSGFDSNSHENFKYDAWRTQFNVVVDYFWSDNALDAYGLFPGHQNNSFGIDYFNTELSFFKSKGANGVADYPDCYKLSDNSATNSDHSPGLVATCGAAARGASYWTMIQEYAQALWDLPLSTMEGTYRYYNGMLYMLSMLFSTGNFRIYNPGNVIRPAPPGVGGVVVGSVNIRNKWSGKVATATATNSNADVKGQPENPAWSSQDWKLEKVYGSNNVRIKNVWTGKYLHVQNQYEYAKIVCYDLNPGWLSEQWIVEPVADENTVRFRNAWSGRYLTIQDTSNYANMLAQSLNTGWTSQEWYLE